MRVFATGATGFVGTLSIRTLKGTPPNEGVADEQALLELVMSQAVV